MCVEARVVYSRPLILPPGPAEPGGCKKAFRRTPLDTSIIADLRRRHAEPHRAHHAWPRIVQMLATAEDIAHGIAERQAFILAVLFHTAVFDPRNPMAAAESAGLMRGALAEETPPAVLNRATALITAICRGEVPETDDPSLRGDAALLLDIGNAVLGADPATYDAYESDLRREHAHLSDDDWASGRCAALRLMLWRERIYRTDRFYLECERRARRNIDRTLARLGA
jgi:predicted metal-dependent HD superfamily phosphohydrolase